MERYWQIFDHNLSREILMKNGIKLLILIFSVGLIVLAFGLFHSFDGFSQTITKTSASSSEILNTPTPLPMVGTTAAKGISPESKERDGLCGAGFVEIPPNFKKAFLNYEANLRDNHNNSDDSYKLKNETAFYGFTFISETKSVSEDGEIECKGAEPQPEEINFVSQDVNDLLTKFISAIIANENEVIAAKSRVSEIADNDSNQIKIQLCIDIECGTENPNFKKATLTFNNEAGLRTAREYASMMLFSSVRSELRRIKRPNTTERELVDTEIEQFIDAALEVGIKNVYKQ